MTCPASSLSSATSLALLLVRLSQILKGQPSECLGLKI